MKALLLWALALVCTGAQALRQEVLDDFRDAAAWKVSASDQVRASLRHDPADNSLCLDYDFAGVSGYAVMRRELPVTWPERFDIRALVKGSGGVNDFQFKLVDSSGDNVWWINRPNTRLPASLTETALRGRQISFAWGPQADRRLRSTSFVEFVIAAGRDGGKGAVCVARLSLHERAPDPVPWPQVQVSQSRDGIEFDLGLVREFNGLTIEWPAGSPAPPPYTLQASSDGRNWRNLRKVQAGGNRFNTLFLPESEARHLRLATTGASRLKPPLLNLKTAADWPDFNAVLAGWAARLPRGEMPRGFVGEQNYWTLVGVDGGGQRSALISEDGALEVGRGGYSIEPAVLVGDGSSGRRITWAGVSASQWLREGHLPLPAVLWQHPAFKLEVEAAADGTRDAPQLLARYTLHNRGAMTQRFTLQLAVRPWQVNPPQQFLSTPGGASPLQQLRFDGRTLVVNDTAPVSFTAPPTGYGALVFDAGIGLDALANAPAPRVLDDPQQHASALLQWRFTLAPGASRSIGLVAPLGGRGAAAVDEAGLQQRFENVASHWRERLHRVQLQLPGDDGKLIADTLRTSLAHMLISRDGPALRPGTRSYARTWIRDGAMMVAGLLRLGEAAAAREFTDWYAGHIFASGKVPCCVDQRGADPVVENDSHGQYLYAVAEVLRHTGDDNWASRHWPQVRKVLAWMEALRQSERTPANQTPARAHYFGLMPPSISHEGYSDKAAYSYWDDFWALRGYKDAVQLAQALGHADDARRWAAWRNEFERELAASIEATARLHGLDHIAGAADRGDFDATSTTMALNPAQAAVPAGLLHATFERYWTEMDARSQGRRPWKDYTPYELRNVGALVRLGQPERAHAMLDFFFRHQRPAGWNQWAEVVLPDAREPRFLGDMPHAWVSSDYIRSALDLLAYDDEREGTLIVGAGLKARWLQQGGIVLRGLSTPYGLFDLLIHRNTSGWRLELPRKMSGLRGGVRLRWPAGLALPRAIHQGRALAWQGRELALPAPPLVLDLHSP